MASDPIDPWLGQQEKQIMSDPDPNVTPPSVIAEQARGHEQQKRIERELHYQQDAEKHSSMGGNYSSSRSSHSLLFNVIGGILVLTVAFILEFNSGDQSKDRTKQKPSVPQWVKDKPYTAKVADRNFIYSGELLNGRFHGKGVFYDKRKKICYKGDFKNSKFHGYGIYMQKNGETIIGKWANGVLYTDGKVMVYNMRTKTGVEQTYKYGRVIKEKPFTPKPDTVSIPKECRAG